MKWFILLLGIMSNASASVLIKIAMTGEHGPVDFRAPWMLVANFHLMGGILLYVLALGFYAVSLTHLPLNVAHPILTAGAIATVALFSFFFFGEPFHWKTIAGLLCISVGVLLIASQVDHGI